MSSGHNDADFLRAPIVVAYDQRLQITVVLAPRDAEVFHDALTKDLRTVGFAIDDPKAIVVCAAVIICLQIARSLAIGAKWQDLRSAYSQNDPHRQ